MKVFRGIALLFLLLLVACGVGQSGQHTYLPAVYHQVAPTPAPVTVRTSDKKGLAVTCGLYRDDLSKSGATWYYTWAPNVQQLAGYESVPMVWGRADMNRLDKVGGTSNVLLTFNEPDYPSQANLTPCEAAQLYRQIEERFPDRLLASPVTLTFSDWLTQFYDCYLSTYGEPPRIDIVAVHCYTSTAEECIGWIETNIQHATDWGAQSVWVTEFGIWPQDEETRMAEYRELINWMEAEPLVGRYAIYTTRVACVSTDPNYIWYSFALFDGNGNYTRLGREYAEIGLYK